MKASPEPRTHWSPSRTASGQRSAEHDRGPGLTRSNVMPAHRHRLTSLRTRDDRNRVRSGTRLRSSRLNTPLGTVRRCPPCPDRAAPTQPNAHMAACPTTLRLRLESTVADVPARGTHIARRKRWARPVQERHDCARSRAQDCAAGVLGQLSPGRRLRCCDCSGGMVRTPSLSEGCGYSSQTAMAGASRRALSVAVASSASWV